MALFRPLAAGSYLETGSDMFTGLITEMGKILSLAPEGGGVALELSAPLMAAEAGIGDSIAINGTCLTVTVKDADKLRFHASSETLKATTMGALKGGDMVNLEPALRPSDRLGGHFVSGHVDAVGRVRSIVPEGQALRYEIETPQEVLKYLVDKGSVAGDGISLTVVKVTRDAFTLVIIPHTAEVTTIGGLKAGDRVNLEADILGKYVYRFMNRDDSDDDSLMESLKEHGFTG